MGMKGGYYMTMKNPVKEFTTSGGMLKMYSVRHKYCTFYKPPASFPSLFGQ
jgi:hypothetical protein